MSKTRMGIFAVVSVLLVSAVILVRCVEEGYQDSEGYHKGRQRKNPGHRSTDG